MNDAHIIEFKSSQIRLLNWKSPSSWSSYFFSGILTSRVISIIHSHRSSQLKFIIYHCQFQRKENQESVFCEETSRTAVKMLELFMAIPRISRIITPSIRFIPPEAFHYRYLQFELIADHQNPLQLSRISSRNPQISTSLSIKK